MFSKPAWTRHGFEIPLNKMKRTIASTLGAAALLLASATFSLGGPILIVSGSVGTSEPGTTAAVVANLQTLHEAVGNIVTVSSDIPVDLSPYAQVWDVRFDDIFALTSAQRAQYLAYLASGGGMFLMGENSSFMGRNNSILTFIGDLGGGSLGFVTPASTQDVIAPFTGPNAVSQVTYAAPGGVNGTGTGGWITKVSGIEQGTGVAWGVGDLPNAQAGALTVVFDVNFMQDEYYLPGSQDLTKNLIGYVKHEVEGVPDSGSTLVLLGLALAALTQVKRIRDRFAA